MSLFVKTTVLLSVLLLASISSSDSKDVVEKLGIKTHVRVYNYLDQNLELTLHCKSADDDLGEQHLHRSDYFEWSFYVNFFGTTQFYCSFQWEGAFHWFDIYIAERDDPICHDCTWRIRQDRPCMLNATQQYGICYPWNS